MSHNSMKRQTTTAVLFRTAASLDGGGQRAREGEKERKKEEKKGRKHKVEENVIRARTQKVPWRPRRKEHATQLGVAVAAISSDAGCTATACNSGRPAVAARERCRALDVKACGKADAARPTWSARRRREKHERTWWKPPRFSSSARYIFLPLHIFTVSFGLPRPFSASTCVCVCCFCAAGFTEGELSPLLGASPASRQTFKESERTGQSRRCTLLRGFERRKCKERERE